MPAFLQLAIFDPPGHRLARLQNLFATPSAHFCNQHNMIVTAKVIQRISPVSIYSLLKHAKVAHYFCVANIRASQHIFAGHMPDCILGNIGKQSFAIASLKRLVCGI